HVDVTGRWRSSIMPPHPAQRVADGSSRSLDGTSDRVVMRGEGAGPHAALARAAGVGVDPGELGAKQKDLRGVVHPEKQRDQRARGAEPRGEAALAEIEADQDLAGVEEQRGEGGADPYVAPADRGARHELVDHREHDRHESEADGEGDALRDELPAREDRPPPTADRRYR